MLLDLTPPRTAAQVVITPRSHSGLTVASYSVLTSWSSASMHFKLALYCAFSLTASSLHRQRLISEPQPNPNEPHRASSNFPRCCRSSTATACIKHSPNGNNRRGNVRELCSKMLEPERRVPTLAYLQTHHAHNHTCYIILTKRSARLRS